MSEITPEKVAHLRHLLASVGDLPWFLADCEGDMQIWRESALQRVSRECSGEIVGYSTPSSYKRNDLVASWDLDTWDEGEDEDDDERRRMAELVVESVNLLPGILDRVSAGWDDAAAVVVEGEGTPIVLPEPAELGISWPDGGDLLTFTPDGITLYPRGVDEWELDDDEALEFAAQLAAMVYARKAAKAESGATS